MTDRRMKEHILFNPKTGISEDGTMHDGVYRPWINQPKKEQTMNREEAIERLKNIKSVPSMFIDEIIKELVEVFKQPPTLADFLGWEEGQEYKWRDEIFRIQIDILQVYDKKDEMWFDSSEKLNEYLRLRQAKEVDTMGIKDSLLDELQELVSSERINDIIKQLREVE